jgi:hypothetical protein
VWQESRWATGLAANHASKDLGSRPARQLFSSGPCQARGPASSLALYQSNRQSTSQRNNEPTCQPTACQPACHMPTEQVMTLSLALSLPPSISYSLLSMSLSGILGKDVKPTQHRHGVRKDGGNQPCFKPTKQASTHACAHRGIPNSHASRSI